jgi:photosystem II stability/assembly factor-like uncharacterized protein
LSPSDLAEQTGQKTIEVQSNINKDGESSWKWGEIRLGNGESLSQIQFLDSNRGWVASDEGSLHETTDGGKTWKRVKLEIPSDRYIAAIDFITPSVGRVVVYKNGDPQGLRDLDGYVSWVMSTGDGGKSWQTQYSDKLLQIGKVRFVNEREGWAVGRKIIKPPDYHDEIFVIHTTDGGRLWTDVSKKLPPGTRDATDIYSVEPSEAMLLSDGIIYSTVNGGQSWQKAGAVGGEPPQTFFRQLGVAKNNSTWVLGGADSREGMWMMFARLEGGNTWKKYKAGGVYLSDAVFLSENEVLACGRIHVEDKAHPFSEKRDGAIMYSSDGGQNWSVVYRNPKVSDINALVAVSAGQVLAVGNDGLILRLEGRSNNSFNRTRNGGGFHHQSKLLAG